MKGPTIPGKTLSACLPERLEALDWRGNRAALAEILPLSTRDWTIRDVLPRLEALDYQASLGRVAGKRPERLMVPGLLLDSDGN